MSDPSLFMHIVSGEHNPDKQADLDKYFPFDSLDSPGIPLPGPSFAMQAQAWSQGYAPEHRSDACRMYLHYLHRRALYDEQFTLNVAFKGQPVVARFVPGHIISQDTRGMGGGPNGAEVVVLGKMPGNEEVALARNFVGPSSEILYKGLREVGIPEERWSQWYGTNLVKFPNLDPSGGGSLAKTWIADCAPLLAEELRLVQPKFMLCLGSEASKAVLGTDYSVTAMVGRVLELQIPLHKLEEPPVMHTIKVMTVTHPAAVYRTPELYDDMCDQLARFWQLVQGHDVGKEELHIDHANIYNERTLKKVVDEIIARDNAPGADPSHRVVAVDAEWHGDHPRELDSYLRTIQFSDRHMWSRCVVLRYQGGAPAFKPSVQAGLDQLKRLFKSSPERGEVRIAGHFLRADLPWLESVGLDLRPEYLPAESAAEMRYHGGGDTSLSYHAYNEVAQLKLETLAVRLTSAPRYDTALQSWKKAYCAKHKLKADELEGYGECPDWILHPDWRLGQAGPNYAAYDPDVTRRILLRLYEPGGFLDSDFHGNNSWQAYWLHHRASAAFLEMEMTGFMVDRDRADEIADGFMTTHRRLLDELKAGLNWPDFAPGSVQQVRAFLFGDRYGTRKDKASGGQLAVRPAGAISLNLPPIKSTGKRSRAWSDIARRNEEHLYTPSTDKEVLGILGHEHPLAMRMRDFRFVSQVLISSLRVPNRDAFGEFIKDDEGNYEYDKGLVGSICHDGRVRTTLYQTKETARASSARPPLQNISSRREDDYSRILGSLHQHPIRSILCVPPGYAGIDVDLTGAELATLAWQCQDRQMVEHVLRNNLPEDHPDHYGIHAQQACKVFRLTDVTPTKSGMKKAGKKGLYVAAKNVDFGVPYGRGALAISRQCAEEGAAVTEDEAQLLIDGYFESYPGTATYLEDCQARVTDPRWMAGPYGSLRRFPQTDDSQALGDLKRQAMNYTIQNGVADAISIALYNLIEYRQLHPELTYLLMLQMHDSVVILTPIAQAERVYHEVIPQCLIHGVPFWPCDLDGHRLRHVREPYHFGVDREVFVNWGEPLKGDQAKALGLGWLAEAV